MMVRFSIFIFFVNIILTKTAVTSEEGSYRQLYHVSANSSLRGFKDRGLKSRGGGSFKMSKSSSYSKISSWSKSSKKTKSSSLSKSSKKTKSSSLSKSSSWSKSSKKTKSRSVSKSSKKKLCKKSKDSKKSKGSGKSKSSKKSKSIEKSRGGKGSKNSGIKFADSSTNTAKNSRLDDMPKKTNDKSKYSSLEQSQEIKMIINSEEGEAKDVSENNSSGEESEDQLVLNLKNGISSTERTSEKSNETTDNRKNDSIQFHDSSQYKDDTNVGSVITNVKKTVIVEVIEEITIINPGRSNNSNVENETLNGDAVASNDESQKDSKNALESLEDDEGDSDNVDIDSFGNGPLYTKEIDTTESM